MKDCTGCIHFDENAILQCGCAEFAYFTMDMDCICKERKEQTNERTTGGEGRSDED